MRSGKQTTVDRVIVAENWAVAIVNFAEIIYSWNVEKKWFLLVTQKSKIRWEKEDGGPLHSLSQPFFLTIEVAEIIPYRQGKAYENVSFLTDLYLKKGWSLRRISNELGCCKATVRKKLIEAGIYLVEQNCVEDKALRKKIQAIRERGLSYHSIADSFNLWKIATRTGDGQWHSKTVREIKILGE